MRRTKTISVKEDVFEDIEERRKLLNFELSSWFDTAYREHHLGLKGDDEQIKKLRAEIDLIKAKKESAKKRAIQILKKSNKYEKEFFSNVPFLLTKDSERNISSMWRLFKTKFEKDIGFREFMLIVEFITSEKEIKPTNEGVEDGN